MHTLDANTIGLWRLDGDSTAGDYANFLDDSGNGYDFTVTGALDIVGGPSEVGRAKLVAASVYGSHPYDAVFTAMFLGDCTLEGWFYPTSTGVQYLWNYGSSGESEATNYLVGVRSDTSGTVSLLMEQGAGGSNISITSTAVMPINIWTHLAVVKEDVGGSFDYHFYINGSFVDTVNGAGPTGGGTQILYAGSSAGGGGFAGAMGAQRWSNIARSAGEISTSFGRAGKDHAVDANTIINLPMDELPDLLDEAGLGHLQLFEGTNRSSTALNNDAGKSRTFQSTRFTSADNWPPLRDVILAAIHDEFTIEFWGRLGTTWDSIASRGAWSWYSTGESPGTNLLGFDITDTLKAQVFSESGSGANDAWESVSPVLGSEAQWDTHHYAFTLVASGGFSTYEVYIDGVLQDTSNGTNVSHDGGDTGAVWLAAGAGTSLRWLGQLDDIRISNKKRSAAEILSSYNAGAASSGVTYRMRGFDQNGGVNDYVFWDSMEVDADASDYSGSAGPVVDVVLLGTSA